MKAMKLTRADKRWLNAYRRELAEKFSGMVERMLIYGSKARGEATAESDLDVLLIVRDEAAKRKRAMREIGYLLDAEGFVIPSIMAYTVGEWERLKQSGSRFREAVERDKVRVL
jgi:predicted nucleotidyltransferase